MTSDTTSCQYCGSLKTVGHTCYLVSEGGITGWKSADPLVEKYGFETNKEALLKDIVDDIKDEVAHVVTHGVKHDQGKPRMDLLPMDALLEVAKVLTFGANKYGDHNWEKGIAVHRLRAAQMRHDAAVEMGEMFDPESGLLHTAHKTCDALMELAMRLRNQHEHKQSTRHGAHQEGAVGTPCGSDKQEG